MLYCFPSLNVNASVPKTCIIFQTKPVPTSPYVIEGPFLSCSQTKYMTYTRIFDINRTKFNVITPHNEITFYGSKYEVISIGISHSSIGALVADDGVVHFLENAKAVCHRWRSEEKINVA